MHYVVCGKQLSGTWLLETDHFKRHDLVYLYIHYFPVYNITMIRLGFFPGRRRGSRGGFRDRSGGNHVLHIGCQLCLILSGLGMADVVTIP